MTLPPTKTGKRAKLSVSKPDVGFGGIIFATAQPIRQRLMNQGASFFMSKQRLDFCLKKRGELKDQLSPFASLRDRVRLGVSVAQGREEVHEILLLLRSELEIANLTVRRR